MGIQRARGFRTWDGEGAYKCIQIAALAGWEHAQNSERDVPRLPKVWRIKFGSVHPCINPIESSLAAWLFILHFFPRLVPTRPPFQHCHSCYAVPKPWACPRHKRSLAVDGDHFPGSNPTHAQKSNTQLAQLRSWCSFESVLSLGFSSWDTPQPASPLSSRLSRDSPTGPVPLRQWSSHRSRGFDRRRCA